MIQKLTPNLLNSQKKYRKKNLDIQRRAFSHGSESAVIDFYKIFLFAITFEFSVFFSVFGTEIEERLDMCLLNFQSSLIPKEIGAYLPLLSW